jgi:hypothetical protein
LIRRKAPVDSRLERKIITGMIVSTDYLREIKQLYRGDYFNLSFSNIVAEWCLEYFKKYESAPNSYIQDIYYDKLKLGLESTQAKLISEFLSGLSKEHFGAQENFNVQYLLDETINHFRKQSIKKIIERAHNAIETDDIEDAEAFIKGYTRVARPEIDGTYVYSDEAISLIWDKKDRDLLFRLPGDLGNKIGTFEREQFIAVMGEQGAGKSLWLQFIGQCAVKAGFNTLILTFELSKRQYINRVIHSDTAAPKESGTVKIPIFDCVRNQEGTCNREKRINKIKLVDEEGVFPEPENTPKKYRVCTVCRENKNFEMAVWYKLERKRRRTRTGDERQKNIEKKL